MDRLRLFLVAIFVSLGGLSLEGALIAMGIPLSLVPELVLIFVIFISFYETSAYGAFLAFLCGLMVDVSSGQLLGPWAGAYVLSFGAVSLISDRIFVESGLSLLSVAIFMTLFSHAVFLLIAVDPISQLLSGWIVLVGKSLTTAFVAPLFFPLLRRVLWLSKSDAIRVGKRGRAYS